ncbi:MAG: alpha/beta fold hydrolase [Phycisphaerales bacterium]|nr:alpha/beta fold hydrolase [Phycisphaerales bacterium]
MHKPITAPQIVTLPVSDGYEIKARLWRGTRPRAVVYLHGIQSHGGWYERSGSLLARDGASVLMPDRRGSGLNETARGDTPGLDRWLEDLTEHVAWLRRESGAARIDLVAVSWGGKPATIWAARNAHLVSRMLLIAPGIFPRVTISLISKARIGLALLGDPQRRYPIPLNDARLFTENPVAQGWVDADPLKLTDATARFFYHSARLDVALSRVADESVMARVDLALAGRDKIIRNDATVAWISRISRGDFGIREFAEASHTLEFESQPDEFESFLVKWNLAN